jgi:hypothetical protein
MKNQKGISLLMVFFIMTIILSVVLGLSTILVNGFKEIRNLGDSLVAFYMADSGIEKTLYYSRQKIPSSPEGVVSGVCNICRSCLSSDCQECIAVGDDCSMCRSCRVSYKTVVDDKKFEVLATIFPNGDYYNLDISVKGFYRGTSRAINLQIANKDLSSSNPFINNPSAVYSAGLVVISADVIDVDGVDPLTVKAHIRNSNNPNDSDVDVVWLTLPEGVEDNYTGTWSMQDGYYFAYIRACDTFNNCGESIKFPITGQ